MAAKSLTPASAKKLEYIRAWNAANPEKRKATVQKYSATHKEQRRKWERQRDPVILREKLRASGDRWSKENPDKERAKSARRRLAHKRQISEMSNEQQQQIRESQNAYQRRYRTLPSKRMGILVIHAKNRAKNRGLAFDGLREIAKSAPPATCPCCQIALDYGKTKGNFVGRAPSLDRFDSTKGYVSSNVRVICTRCNSLKSNASAEELEAVIAYMRS